VKRALLFVVVTAALLLSTRVSAAAYYVGEVGAKSIARGGANLVNPEDPSAAWLNPAAITKASGLQLHVDLNLVWMASSFTRDCGGKDNGCAPLDDVSRSYADGKHKFDIKDRRATFDPDAGAFTSYPAEPGQLGQFNTPSQFDGNTAVTNQAGVQPIPRMYISFNTDSLGLDGFAAGVFVYAPNAGDYDFGSDTPTRYSLVERDLLEVYYGLALGYRFGDWIGVGASLQAVTSGLRQVIALSADQYGNEDPGYDIVAQIEGVQHLIPSAAFGIWSNPLKPLGIGDVELGASVQLPRVVKATGPITIQSLGGKLQEEYIDAGLVAIEDKDATATAEFVLPPFYRVGVKYGLDDVTGDGSRFFGFDIEADFVYEQWSTYDHVYLATKGLTADLDGDGPNDPEELDPITQPKDWQDAWSVRLGGTAAFFDKMIQLHGGAFYETSAIPNETYSIELVDGDKLGLGTGVTAKLFGVALTVGYSHIFIADRTVGQESVVFNGNSGPSITLPGTETRTRVAMGKYSAGYDMLNVSLNVGFDEMLGFGVYNRTSAAPIVPEEAPAATQDAAPAVAPVDETPPPAVVPGTEPAPAVDPAPAPTVDPAAPPSA
jgi:long-subunit fatty acid transport protein